MKQFLYAIKSAKELYEYIAFVLSVSQIILCIDLDEFSQHFSRSS